MWQVKCESKCISLQTIVITFIMAKELITSNIIQNGILRCVEETLREEKEPKKRVRRRWFCKIASFKWPHGWSFSTLLCSRVPGQMGRWPAILDSRRASFEKEWSKKGIFWRWPHHFWLLRNSCKSRKGKMRYTWTLGREIKTWKRRLCCCWNCSKPISLTCTLCKKCYLWERNHPSMIFSHTWKKTVQKSVCDTHRRISEMACQS